MHSTDSQTCGMITKAGTALAGWPHCGPYLYSKVLSPELLHKHVCMLDKVCVQHAYRTTNPKRWAAPFHAMALVRGHPVQAGCVLLKLMLTEPILHSLLMSLKVFRACKHNQPCRSR